MIFNVHATTNRHNYNILKLQKAFKTQTNSSVFIQISFKNIDKICYQCHKNFAQFLMQSCQIQFISIN